MNPFKRNLLIGYGISLLLLIVSAVASYVSIHNLLFNSTMVNHTNEVIKNLDAITLAAKDGEAGQRGYLLTNDLRFLTPYKGAYARALTSVQKVKDLTADNAAQKEDVQRLKGLVDERFATLQSVIDNKTKTAQLSAEALEKGRSLMEELSTLIRQIEDKEQAMLVFRTQKLNKFASSTPTLIIIASLLAILVTVISFLRVNADFEKRTQLQQELQKRNEEVLQRIQVIEGITTKIAAGNFSTRVAEADRENLGVLAVSLDKMAESLD